MFDENVFDTAAFHAAQQAQQQQKRPLYRRTKPLKRYADERAELIEQMIAKRNQ